MRLEVRVVFVVEANYSLDRMRFLPRISLVENVFNGPTQSNSMVTWLVFRPFKYSNIQI